MDGKLFIIIKKILIKLFKEYYNLTKIFLFNETETLPLYYPYDYKIKLFPKQTLSYNKAYVILSKEFLAVKKYINNYLIKGFI